jgi:hypothetical protein
MTKLEIFQILEEELGIDSFDVAKETNEFKIPKQICINKEHIGYFDIYFIELKVVTNDKKYHKYVSDLKPKGCIVSRYFENNGIFFFYFKFRNAKKENLLRFIDIYKQVRLLKAI